MKNLWEAWKLFYRDIKKNHWTKVNFSAKWALWALAAMLLTIWIVFSSGLGLIGIVSLYGVIVVFDLYLVCRDKKSSFSTFCDSCPAIFRVRYVYGILSIYILLLMGIMTFFLFVVQFNQVDRGAYLFFSSVYVWLMILLLLSSSVPLIFIKEKKIWNLWAGVSLAVSAFFHLMAWRSMKGENSWMLRKSIMEEEEYFLWVLLEATIAGLSFLIGYRQSVAHSKKQKNS